MKGSDGAQVKVLRATGQRGVMTLDQSLSREIKVVDTTSLLGLEEVALEVGLGQRLPVGWVVANAAREGRHYLWAALCHELFHRPDVPRHLRCELLLQLRSGEWVKGLLDVLPVDFDALAKVASRNEGR